MAGVESEFGSAAASQVGEYAHDEDVNVNMHMNKLEEDMQTIKKTLGRMEHHLLFHSRGVGRAQAPAEIPHRNH